MESLEFPEYVPEKSPVDRDGEKATPPRPVERSPATGDFPNELGRPVALPDLRVVLDEVAVAFDSFFVHEEGMHGTLRVAFRDPMTDDRPWGHYTFHVHPFGSRRPGERAQALWRLGMRFADRRTAFTPSLEDPTWHNDFVLSVQGGGGSSIEAVHRIYVSPVPPAGPLEVLLDLADHGTHRLEADAQPLAEAAEAGARVWPLRSG